MKKVTIILALGCSLLFSGCINIIEELWLNRDGSGKLHVTMDMGELMSNEFMMNMMEEEMAESEENDVDPFQTVDSVFYFRDAPDSIKSQFADNPGFLDKVSLKTKINKEEKLFLITFVLDFDDFSDVNYFYDNISKLQNDGEEGPMDFGGMFGDGGNPYTLSGNLFKRVDQDMGKQLDMKEEDMEMAKMMFTGATYKTIYHFPGKAKKVSNKSSTLSNGGKTVTTEVDFIQMLEGKANVDNTIKFKNK